MKIISSYSIKGGVGKTALAVNLAFALCDSGHRTLLLESETFEYRCDRTHYIGE
jgi:MinD-like ATPase involved in chromosome partitioning or flagellar assembly